MTISTATLLPILLQVPHPGQVGIHRKVRTRHVKVLIIPECDEVIVDFPELGFLVTRSSRTSLGTFQQASTTSGGIVLRGHPLVGFGRIHRWAASRVPKGAGCGSADLSFKFGHIGSLSILVFYASAPTQVGPNCHRSHQHSTHSGEIRCRVAKNSWQHRDWPMLSLKIECQLPGKFRCCRFGLD